MPDIIRDILDDLYAIAPELKTREAELIPLIKKLLAAKPEAKLDATFREQLRDRILAAASEPQEKTYPISNLFTMRKFSYALMGLFVVAVVGVGAFTYLNRPEKNSTIATDSASNIKLSITNKAASAFGAFSSNPLTTQSVRQENLSGLGGGAAKTISDAASPAIGMPAPTYYEYVYTGTDITIPDMQVLKRSNQLPSSTLQNVLQSANLGLIDLTKFSNLKLQQVSLAEDRDEGYSLSIDLNAGSIGLFQNWERWSRLVQAENKNVAAETKTTLPADDELIAMANAFLDKYGIPHSAYANPIVPKYFMGYGNETAKVASQYIQSLQVVYPLLINGKAVVNENGYPAGLTVDIDINLNRVMAVSNLTSLAYEASAYPLVSDTTKVLDVVKRGGIYGSTINDPKAQKIQVEVGSPFVGYSPSQYQIDQTSTEYLIPALIFPVTKAPTGTELYRTAIVVPLVKDVLEPKSPDTPVTIDSSAATAPDSNSSSASGNGVSAGAAPEAQ